MMKLGGSCDEKCEVRKEVSWLSDISFFLDRASAIPLWQPRMC